MRLDESLTCAEIVELVTEYLDGALVDGDRERFEQHIVVCAGCTSHLEQMRATIEVVGKITEEDLPPEAAAQLLEAFRGWKRS